MDVSYITYDPKVTQLKEPFRKALNMSVEQEREGFLVVNRSVESVKQTAEKHGHGKELQITGDSRNISLEL